MSNGLTALQEQLAALQSQILVLQGDVSRLDSVDDQNSNSEANEVRTQIEELEQQYSALEAEISAYGGTYTVGSDGDTGLFIDRNSDVGKITFNSPTTLVIDAGGGFTYSDPDTGQSWSRHNDGPIQDLSGPYLLGAVGGKVIGTAISGTRPGGLYNNLAVRKDYLAKAAEIHAKIDQSLPLRDRAIKAYEMRNALKIEARGAMNDAAELVKLEKDYPIPTLDAMLKRAVEKGFTGDDVWQYIYDRAIRTNPGVNKRLGVGTGGG